MDGGYTARKDAIEKCYQAAKKRGFQVFAVQNGGWCAASRLAAKTFDKYGKSSACKTDGEGGPWANQVYYIKGKQTLTSPTTQNIEINSQENRMITRERTHQKKITKGGEIMIAILASERNTPNMSNARGSRLMFTQIHLK